jgi:hypothetical protein
MPPLDFVFGSVFALVRVTLGLSGGLALLVTLGLVGYRAWSEREWSRLT